MVAITPVAVYLGLRVALAGVSLSGFCETMGLFNRPSQTVCYADLSFIDRVKQQGWNVVATFFGTFFPDAFSAEGRFQATPSGLGTLTPWSSLFVSSLMLLAAAVAAVRRPTLGVTLLVVIGANALLNLALYRQRNQLAGMIALDVATVIGLLDLVRFSQARRPIWRAALGLCLIAVAVSCFYAATQRNSELAAVRAQTLRLDPCESLRQYPRDIDASVVAKTKRARGMRNPDCREGVRGGKAPRQPISPSPTQK